MDLPYLSNLLIVGGVSLIAAISPGPDFVIVVRNSLVYSRAAGQWTALGICLGLIVHLTYTLIGLAVLIVESPAIYRLLTYSGAVYLGYLGITSIMASLKSKGALNVDYEKHERAVSPGAMLWQGFFTNVLNPKCAVFFISLFSLFISEDTPVYVRLEYAFVNLFVTLVWFVFLAYLMTGERIAARLASYGAYIDRVMGSALVLLSLKILLV